MMDRVREAVFSALGPISGFRVLDLYAGAGTLGLEALSRGAVAATLVEADPRTAAVATANIEVVGLGGEVVKAEVDAFLKRDDGSYDLVFVDPPFALKQAELAKTLGNLEPRLAAAAVVVVHRRADGGDPAPWPDQWRVIDRRAYGDSEITRLEKESPA